MAYEIRLSRDAKSDIAALRMIDRRKVLQALETHLRHEPTKESKSRIKRLRKMETPQYRLRVDEIRVFDDVVDRSVEIIAVIDKDQAAEWLAREGIVTEEHSTTESGRSNPDEDD